MLDHPLIPVIRGLLRWDRGQDVDDCFHPGINIVMHGTGCHRWYVRKFCVNRLGREGRETHFDVVGVAAPLRAMSRQWCGSCICPVYSNVLLAG